MKLDLFYIMGVTRGVGAGVFEILSSLGNV